MPGYPADDPMTPDQPDESATGASPLHVTEMDAVSVVRFPEPGLLDAYHVKETAGHLYALVEKERRRLLVLDFSGIRMISSQALGMLLNLRQKLQALAGGLALAGIDPRLSRVFKITRLQDVFAFCPDVPAAVRRVTETTPYRAER